MQIVIDIPEEVKHKVYAYGLSLCPSDKEQLIHAIMNGTPLDTHDEEIIATTVESIWGKPPYTELLDKIRAEIDRQQKWLLHAGYTAYNVDIALDAIKSVVAESEE